MSLLVLSRCFISSCLPLGTACTDGLSRLASTLRTAAVQGMIISLYKKYTPKFRPGRGIWVSVLYECVCVCERERERERGRRERERERERARKRWEIAGLQHNRQNLITLFRAYWGHPWFIGSVLGCWSTGRVIDPAPGAWFMTKILLIRPGYLRPSITLQCRIMA